MKTNTNDYFFSYEEWREAMTNRCGITLTREYCDERVRALQNREDSSTSQFINSYGLSYRDKVISWFKRAAKDS